MSTYLTFSRAQFRLLCGSAICLGAVVGLIAYALGGWFGEWIGNGIEDLLRMVR